MTRQMRAVRRAHDRRMKVRARRIMRLWFAGKTYELRLDPRDVGRNASTHCRPCGCWMCQADSKEIPPLRERPFDDPELP
ncbi:MAG: hypothetical protein WD696_19985 [Bryobacteraceae bacterium]